MGKLILTSGGYLDGQRGDKCDKLIEKYSSGKSILLIDNATITGSNTKGIPILLSNFNKIAKSVSQLTITKDNLNSIKKYDTIYIIGGDLFPFIKLISECNLKNAFLNYLKQGGVIIGESVGSMIFGKDLKWVYDIKKGTKPKYDIILKSYKGLGIVDINFFPHWNKISNSLKEKTLNYEQEFDIKITKVNDGEFFELDNI